MPPISKLDRDDYPKGPEGRARWLMDRIAELEAERAVVPRLERRPINQQLHVLRGLMRWCKTRAGYVEHSDAVRGTGSSMV